MRRLSLGKDVRSHHIRRYMQEAGYRRAVCFSCGNAGGAPPGGGGGGLGGGGWWTVGEIRRAWPEHFDATSGHLPVSLMSAIGAEFRSVLCDLGDEELVVSCGSGETLVCLALAYAEIGRAHV